MLSHVTYITTLLLATHVTTSFVAADDTTSLELDLSITDNAQNDFSHKVTVFHQHFDTTRPQKREISRAMDSCPDGTFFVASACVPATNPQRYRIFCSFTNGQPNGYNFIPVIQRECLPTEVCVTRRSDSTMLVNGLLRGVAYCVAMVNFVEIAQTQTASTANINVPVADSQNGQSHRTVMAEAVLTGETNTTSLQALAMSIRALNQQPVAHTLLNGTARCMNCSNVRLQPLPPDTQILRARIIIEPSMVGKLFLATLTA